MSNLSIGLVTSPSEESKQLISLLEALGVQVSYHITPDEILSSHIEDESLHVWLLNVDDDHWHDNIDQLLDESEASIYFNEPGTLSKQSHPDYWCQKLVSRLYELTGLSTESASKSNEPALKSEGLVSPASQSSSDIEQTASKPSLQSNDDSIQSKPGPTATLDSADELSSALDQLETNSIGLPSDIAADLVSELESISPDLDTSIEDSLSLEAELSLDQDFSIDEELSLDDELNELSILDEKIELEADQLDDFSEITLDVSEPDFTLDDTKAAGIADEIIALAAEPEGLVSELESTDKMLDEIDFSSSSIPILESAREDDQKTLESIYGPQDDEAPSSNNNDSLSESDKLEAIEIEAPLQDSNEPVLELESELSFDVDELDDEITGKANFIEQESNDDEQISSIEGIELDELALTSIAQEKDTGNAVFLEEVEPSALEEIQVEETASIVKQENDGLSLESIEAQPIRGKAVFLEEESEQQPESILVEPATLDDGGLSLESIGEKPIDGKAKFVIDDQPKESELPKQPLVAEKKPVVEDSPEDDLSGLNLQPIDDPNETSGLNDEILQPDDSEPDVPEKAPSELDFDVDLHQESPATELEDLPALVEIDTHEAVNETQEFEIPMLDESATGLDFEEVVEQSTGNELTSCWAIGASLGGPAAVKRFLQSLPADINASFIVTQHIDENFLPVLAEILSSNSHFDVQVATGSNSISAGKVYLAPLKGKLIFLKDGSMLVDHSQKWSGPYLPCIDDVIESLAAIYGAKSGAIIFSGMGQDGLKGVKKMLSMEGQVWAQSVETCANSSMPEAVINAGLASVVAAPEVLADRLVDFVNQ